MSDQPTPDDRRTEVVSIRFSPAEVDAIRTRFGNGKISEHIREAALTAAENGTPVSTVRTWRGEAWVLLAQAARVISIRRAPGYLGSGVGLWTPADARKLAAALLEAAEVAEQRNLADEAWDAEHAGAAS